MLPNVEQYLSQTPTLDSVSNVVRTGNVITFDAKLKCSTTAGKAKKWYKAVLAELAYAQTNLVDGAQTAVINAYAPVKNFLEGFLTNDEINENINISD